MRRWIFLPLLLIFVFPLRPQNQSLNADEQFSYVGMTLADLFERFGPPKTVITARGNEVWQDDVVFQYAEGDFYIHRDRVWQVKLVSLPGITNRDRKPAVLRVLGNTAEDMGDYVLFPVSGKDWPLMLRVIFNNSGLVTALYIYRPDY